VKEDSILTPAAQIIVSKVIHLSSVLIAVLNINNREKQANFALC